MFLLLLLQLQLLLLLLQTTLGGLYYHLVREIPRHCDSCARVQTLGGQFFGGSSTISSALASRGETSDGGNPLVSHLVPKY